MTAAITNGITMLTKSDFIIERTGIGIDCPIATWKMRGIVSGARREVVTVISNASGGVPPKNSATRAIVMPVGVTPAIKKAMAHSGERKCNGMNKASGMMTNMNMLAITSIRQSLAYLSKAGRDSRKLDVKNTAMRSGVEY